MFNHIHRMNGRDFFYFTGSITIFENLPSKSKNAKKILTIKHKSVISFIKLNNISL